MKTLYMGELHSMRLVYADKSDGIFLVLSKI